MDTAPSAAPIASQPNPTESRLAFWYPRAILIVASAFFAQLYTLYAVPYLNLSAYVAGHERRPFQTRELMRYPLGWAMRSAFLQRLTAGHKGTPTPALLFTELVTVAAILLSGWAAVRLYRWAAPRARAPWLAFAVLLVVCLFNFGVFAPYYYPYDLPSVAFLGWGLYFVLTQRFWPLLILFVFATWNRETSLFLILALAANALYRTGRLHLRSLRRADILQILTLSFVWIAIQLALLHRYAANPTEAGSRIAGNLRMLANPVLWPLILSAGAFLMPYVWLKRDRISPPGLRACVLLLPFWALLLLWRGEIIEVRIFGDISVLIAVCAALLLTAELAPSPDSTRT